LAVITITPIPALDSNYFWVIQPTAGNPNIYVVDPGDAAPVIDFLRRNHLVLAAILITHRHHDHTDGIAGLLEQWPVPVYGPDSPLIPLISHPLIDGDVLALDGLEFKLIGVPGHTWEHIAYVYAGAGAPHPLLFCGDSLFAGGCGRRFDGTAEVMWASLQKLAALPDDTQIYCAHEYTLANLEFAIAVEPDNRELVNRLKHVKALRSHSQMTLPSTILLEKQTNPFLRCQLPGIKTFVENRCGGQMVTSADVFGALRAIKDNWPQ
jgi:hydroxyacylglutathione hydrolase